LAQGIANIQDRSFEIVGGYYISSLVYLVPVWSVQCLTHFVPKPNKEML